MSNGLTGDFEAAVEVHVEALNRFLATLHQKGAFEGASPSFLHSTTARVGEVPKDSKFELAEAFLLQYFEAETLDAARVPNDVLKAVQTDLLSARRSLLNAARAIDSVKPSAGQTLIQSMFAQLFVIRGTVKVQISALTVTFPEGTTSEATVRCQVRALYMPDPGTLALPAPIHGEVQIGFVVKYHAMGGNGQPVLEVEVTGDDGKILFTPAAGTSLTAVEAKLIASEIRRFVRTKFKPMTVDLPSKQDFPFHRFKSLGSGSFQAIALPFNLSPTAKIPAFADFPGLFLAPGDDFAVAFSGKYIESLLKDSLDQLRNFVKKYVVTIGFPVPPPVFWHEETFVFQVSVSDVTLVWKVGKVTLTVDGSWSTDPDEAATDFTIAQDLTLQLNTTTQKIALNLVGGLQISGLPDEVVDKAEEEIEDMRDAALDDAKEQIKGVTDSIRIDDGLKPFDAQAKSTFNALDIGPGGVVLHGTTTASQRLPVMVMPADVTLDGAALSALKSWIPAGTIEKFVWSWVSQDPSSPNAGPWGGTEHEVSRSHSFLFQPQQGGGSPGSEKPPAEVPPWETYQLCLRVEGTRVPSKPGPPEHVSGGTTCQVEQPEWVAIVPSWWDSVLLVPVWGPDPGPESILEGAMVAHVNVRSQSIPPPNARTTSLIHFAGTQPRPPLSTLGEALRFSKHRDTNVPIVIVLPLGSFAQTRALVERRWGSFAHELHAPLVVTEDYEGSWTRAFDVAGGEATYLLSGEGELLWSYQGPLEAASLTAVLDQHVRAGPRRISRPLRLAVRAGQAAPELLLEDGQGGGLPLSRLRGRRAVLLFWKSCSRPCLAELRRLQHVHDRGDQRAPVIMAVGDGETPERIAEVARAQQLRFTLVPDPDRRIARRYGVNCWPTLLSINEEGLIDAIQSGVTHDRGGVPKQ